MKESEQKKLLALSRYYSWFPSESPRDFNTLKYSSSMHEKNTSNKESKSEKYSNLNDYFPTECIEKQ